MAVQWADRVKVTTATTGTGTINLGAAVAGFRTFAAAVTAGSLASGATVYYVIEDTGSAWETGSGTYTAGTPDTLTRTVSASSAGGTTAISLSGSAVVYIAPTAASLVTAQITSGTIDGTVIGPTTLASGAFTTVYANTATIGLGSLVVGSNGLAQTAAITFDSATNQVRQFTFQSAGLIRWTFGVNSATESGSNAGADFSFANWDDSGSFLGNAILIARATGAVTIANLAGVGTNSSAPTGAVGEVVSSTIPTGSAVSLVTATAKTITSISLTAGDWDVWGQITTKPAGTTTQTVYNAGISTTTNTLPTPSATTGGLSQMSATFTAGTAISMAVTPAQLSLAATTTVYLVASVTFGTSTNAAFGFIAARRRR